MDSRRYIDGLERHGREQYKMYKPYRVRVPLRESGKWRIRSFETTMGIEYLRLARDGRPPGLGKFTALSHDGRGMVMSDTGPEIDDLRMYLGALHGHVLISGLGLGMVVHILTKCDRYSGNVASITVLEKEADVIALSGTFYEKSDPRVKIIHADALEWTPPKGSVYDAAWHDIWDSMCEDSRPQMTSLRRRYQRYVAKGQQFCWGQAVLDAERRRSSW
jgi:hypothetical protein